MSLRKGKPKSLLESSINCALLAVEIYNKPRTPFRVESYITLMIMAWTRLLLAFFNKTKGEIYFYKKNGRYITIDGEKKAWDLTNCIKEYNQLSETVKVNLEFFIKLRNKIEHRIIDKDDIGIMIFGECQSMLYNFENELIKLFGEEYALNENLAFTLQFSRIRTKKQLNAQKKLFSNELKDLIDFISKYRSGLDDAVFASQEFSIKLIQVPKISNTNRNDLAIEFVNWNSLSSEDKANYDNLITIVKDKIINKEAINPGKLKPGMVIAEVNKFISPNKINLTDHKYISAIFKIRPYKKFLGISDPLNTNIKYCHYDEAHEDYVYKDTWVNFLIKNIATGKLIKSKWKKAFDEKQEFNISDFEVVEIDHFTEQLNRE